MTFAFIILFTFFAYYAALWAIRNDELLPTYKKKDHFSPGGSGRSEGDD